jgi:hypothetical protein
MFKNVGRNHVWRSPKLVVLAAGAFSLLFAIFLTSGAGAYSFGPTVTGLGPEQTAFDYSADHCAPDDWDIPDEPARAFKDDRGRVQLHFTAFPVRRNIGSDLNVASSVGHHDCTVVLNSAQNSDPSKYDDFSWIAAPYTTDGRNVYSLLHHEYRAWLYGQCAPPNGDTTACWYNSINLATSTNSGDLFTHTAAPSHLVASQPDRWVNQTGPYGVFSPSNIVKKVPDDGYYYNIVRAKEPAKSDISCVMRTKNLADPTSWRAWDGYAYWTRFVNPYTYPFTPTDTRAGHLCKDVGGNLVTGVSEGLTYNTYFQKYLLIGSYGGTTPGFYYSLSDDLIRWTPPKLLLSRETAQSYVCGDPDPVRDPSLLDPASSSRNFETTGRDPYVYYKILHTNGSCSFGPDRDLLRIPIRFTGTVPVASFTATPAAPVIGAGVTLNASATTDPGGNPITSYEWDLDGNGTYETSSGSNPVKTTSFTRARSGNTALRVTDSEGFQDIVVRQFNVNAQINFQPNSVPTPAGYTKDTGAAFNSGRGFGWVRQDSLSSSSHVNLDLTPNTVDRDPSDSDSYSQRLDTLLFMQYPTNGSSQTAVRTPGAWEMALACGAYRVTVTVGDSRYVASPSDPADSSTHRINVEGEAVIAAFQPTSSVRFRTATTVVPVCDGRLTIDAIGGTNTKLNSVTVTRVARKINFQPFAAPKPTDYAKDSGKSFNLAKRGYGWVRQDSLAGTHVNLDLSPNTIDRDPADTDSYDQRLDTILFMQYPTNGSSPTAVRTPGAWEMLLPCGTYNVTVTVGDSRFVTGSGDPADTSTHRINIEGVNAIAGFVPTSGTRFQTATKTVNACDGRLTIDATGGTNTKLVSVDVTLASY